MNATRILFTVFGLLATPSIASAAPITWCETGPGAVCWAEDATWEAPAQAITWEWIDVMEEAEIIEPSAPLSRSVMCWAATFGDFHFCTVDVDGALLWGMPYSEFDPLEVGGSCGSVAGPWTGTFEYNGTCFGSLSGLGIALDL